ncbi:GIY-YIG nuclease family protein [Magnetospirillum gryphiswaldense]|uniref:GIY-YIG nuclease family protein n=1 Tax=Magnetospirillum gryphiswaldense TaxID=55518 RepID=UPI000D03646A|nr:GIY-YIG nuclease family protein [Magnetospirillum gryphiswaldense]AVM74321.1 GIY-YIG nuclease superfamily protein [Magnetospirillum gryphiswaldense MSR-1]AVM78224.1 GIY-YIG nuclease superfamily protein [Magnetospirillum gryphiswaldense]
MEWFVYVLISPADLAYTGIAKDVDARLRQHNAGKGARFTRGRGPWRLIHLEGPMEHGDALRRELAIKGDAAFKRRLKAVSSPAISLSERAGEGAAIEQDVLAGDIAGVV